MASILKKRRVLAFKIETTPGTPEALTATEAIFVFDPILQGEIPVNGRKGAGSLSDLPGVPGATKGTATFSVELAGDGADVSPTWTGLFKACGMTVTAGVVQPTSDFVNNYKTVTIGVYENVGGGTGVFKVLSGAMGTWELECENGKVPMIKFTFTGIWNAPTDATGLALPTYTIIPPKFQGATLTIGAHTPVGVSKFSLNYGGTVTLIEDATKASGYNRAYVTGRSIKGKLDPHAEAVAAWDVFGLWRAGTTGALNVVIGTAAHNIITIAGPACQYENVQEADRNEIVTTDQDFALVSLGSGTPPTYDDELTLTFS